MVNITEFDQSVALVMGLAIVVMSFVFPALGLADVETGAGEMPEFNITTDQYDFGGESPESPVTPSSGTMDWNGSQPVAFSNNQIWLNGGTSGGYELLILPETSNSTAYVTLHEWQNGNVTSEEEVYINETGQVGLLEVGQYVVTFEVTEFEVVNSTAGTVYTEIEYQIVETPITNGGWLDRIPIVGGLVEATEVTAATLLWMGSLLIWGVQSLIDVILNAGFAMFELAVFWIDLWVWIASTYGAVIDGASDWAVIFVSLPGVLLSLVFAKFAYVVAVGLRG